MSGFLLGSHINVWPEVSIEIDIPWLPLTRVYECELCNLNKFKATNKYGVYFEPTPISKVNSKYRNPIHIPTHTHTKMFKNLNPQKEK